ncbi:putative PIG3 family NAD(P)H quinone oxidoreductase [Azospirillum canadense]|nr:NAD(P)H-quinone oxidoreductase [Azospirillum canadense]MCW2241711.1 putative PIG3 family NAD(P)H quinone oxidoreductase [Azospirillum canadense]
MTAGVTVDGLPGRMIAIAITEPGGPEVLRAETRAVPVPKEGEVLIRVAAAGMNRGDLLQRQGLYPPPPGASDLPGLEVSGLVAACGPGVAGLAVGDRVCALVAGGGYAEYCAAPAAQCLPVPDGLDLATAAALPEALCTVWTNLVERGRLRAGDNVLIHGGASGIGTIAIQAARFLSAARVFATAGSPDKLALCAELGADRAIDHRNEDFVAIVKDATGGRGVDVILDMVGGDYLERNIEALAVEGRLVHISFIAGSRVCAELRPVMTKRLTITGSTLRGRSPADKAAIVAGVRADLWPRVADGQLRAVLDRGFALADAAAAHRYMHEGRHRGKILLHTGRRPSDKKPGEEPTT